MDWQPIDSAPKDGGWIIAYCDGHVMPLIWVEADEYCDYKSGWCFGTADWGGTLYDGVNEVRVPPTHWMPLPPPPTV